MLIKVTKGSDAAGLTRYVLDTQKQKRPDDDYPEAIVATNMIGRNPEELAYEFNRVISLNPRVKRTMAHYSISLPPGEVLVAAQMSAISRALLDCMGHQLCPFFAVQHHDQEARNQVQHWHVVTSTVDDVGQWVDDAYSKLKLRGIEDVFEAHFDLIRSPRKPRRERKNLTTGEYRLKLQTGQKTAKEKLWEAIDQAAKHETSLPMLLLRLKAQHPDISVTLHPAKDHIKGISYAIDGIAFAGYKLGAAYSFGGLQRHLGLAYDPTRHDDLLRQLETTNSAECHELLNAIEAQKSSTPSVQVDLA
ncbi:MAG: relaxase/mobilization nuclease domain-containing protein [Cyanobacteria bacterium J06635_15]